MLVAKAVACIAFCDSAELFDHGGQFCTRFICCILHIQVTFHMTSVKFGGSAFIYSPELGC